MIHQCLKFVVFISSNNLLKLSNTSSMRESPKINAKIDHNQITI